MSDEERKVYTGVTSLDSFLNSVVMFGSTKPPMKRTASEQKYARLRSWMVTFSKRYSFDGNEINATAEEGVPMFPTEDDLKRNMGISFWQFEKIVLGFNDEALRFSFPEKDIPELGIKKQTNYVIMKSLYPKVFAIVNKNKNKG
jgi:hypothetical protein